eukprot:gb/GEZN01008303.1/.p1 GENE.gb/GEZN01008303.1/~~gb/GEZN01008303.1/.p1  ORF type:complete len:337 (+),score=61.00 gb/GEZN01008303.1/:66-1076(+)
MLVPAYRMHCITYQHLSNGFPFYQTLAPDASVLAARPALISFLRAGLGCDEMLAETLLCHLLSHVHNRRADQPVGSLSIGLEFPAKSPETPLKSQQFAKRLAQLYCVLLPKVKVLILTPEALNAAQFGPKKDYEKERILQGELQLSAGTVVVADETHMTAGTLQSQGIQNMRMLARVAAQQVLEYDFKFYQSAMPVDLPCLIISRGKSLIKPSFRLELPSLVVPENMPALPEPALLTARRFLLAARMVPFELNEEAAKMATDSFVERRQQDASLSPDFLHLCLTFGRLQAMSRMETKLTTERWRQATILASRGAKAAAPQATKIVGSAQETRTPKK